MTDLRQAAQQALEALETCDEDEWHDEDDFGMVQTYDEDKVAKAITALREALKQPEQSKPLTDEEIQTIHDTYYRRMGPQEFARAIEQAHNIKEGT